MVVYDKEGNKYEANIKRNRAACPKCSDGKKDNPSLSWFAKDKMGKCHKCDSFFFETFERFEKEKEFVKPEFKNNTDLSDKAIQWFQTRGISQFTLREMKVSEGNEWMPQKEGKFNTIQFNYFKEGELINTKFRTGDKCFKMVSGAELLLYNIDSIRDTEDCVIVEGEMDALTLYECGIRNVVSVPNGANKKNNNLGYLDGCIEFFENKKKVIIATDNDRPGLRLMTELAARLGVEICYRVDFEECKDINEVLMKHGKDKVIEIINGAEPFPVDGVFTATDYKAELDNLYEFGLQKGLTIDVPGLDDIISFETQRLYLVTGIPGHGKSEFLDYLIERLNIKYGMKAAYFTPENRPMQLHISKMIEKLIGKKFSKSRMSQAEYDMAMDHIKDNFFYIEPKEDFKLDTILSKARHLVFTKGIKALVIDPYNKLEHNIAIGQSETNYISKFLDTLINFGIRNNIIIFLVAHPTKMLKDKKKEYEVPTLYDISGSAHFYNKTDFGLCVYRQKVTNEVIVHVQKVKFRHLGKEGFCTFKYDFENGRYAPFDNDKFVYNDDNHLIKIEQIQEQELEPNQDFDFNSQQEPPF